MCIEKSVGIKYKDYTLHWGRFHEEQGNGKKPLAED